MNPNYTLVADRANHRCEYCRAPEIVFNFPFEVEHITPTYRGGTEQLINLALACRACNLRKGTKISAIDTESNIEAPLFNPRQNNWDEHFQIKKRIGSYYKNDFYRKVTIAVLTMNAASQVTARQLWIRLGLFP